MDVSAEELEDYVTTQWNYTFVGYAPDGEAVYATPDKKSYVFIYSATLSDGTPVTYAAYIKRTTASARSADRGQLADRESIGRIVKNEMEGSLHFWESFKHYKEKGALKSYITK